MSTVTIAQGVALLAFSWIGGVMFGEIARQVKGWFGGWFL